MRPLHTLNVKLEHGCELRPEGHADTIVVEVEHWNFIPLLHKLFVLLVQLDAKEDCIDVYATMCASPS